MSQMYSLHVIPVGADCPPKVVKLHLISGKSWLLDHTFNTWSEIKGGDVAKSS